MAKPPFKYKSTPPRPTSVTGVQPQDVSLAGTGDALGLYSDVFLVVNEVESGMANIFFYQRQLADRGATLGTTQTGSLYSSARCITRIVMSKDGIEKLLVALAENRGYTIIPKEKTGEDK